MPPIEAGYTYAVVPTAVYSLFANQEESIYGHLRYILKLGVSYEKLYFYKLSDNAVDSDDDLAYREAHALVESHPLLAFEKITLLANKGHPKSMLALAYCYHDGIGTEIDNNLAEIWLERAYEEGPEDVKTSAQDKLLLLRYEKACDLREEAPDQAFEEFRQLSEAGDPDSMKQLAWCYDKGIGTTKDPSHAVTWYQRAYETGAEENKDDALYYLGNHYLTEKDYDKALETFRLGADLNYPSSLYHLGLLYKNGEGVEKNLTEALLLIEKAYENGSDDIKRLAQEDLFWLKFQKAYALRAEAPEQSFKEFYQLAEEGYAWGMLQLAWRYERANGTHRDLSLAKLWYQKAYETGSEDVKGEAIYYLGRLYFREKEYLNASKTFSLGEDLDFPGPIYQLAQLYKKGKGVKKNTAKARALFEKAISLGHIWAKGDLALLLMTGRLGLKNIKKGFLLYIEYYKEAMAYIDKGGDLEDLYIGREVAEVTENQNEN